MILIYDFQSLNYLGPVAPTSVNFSRTLTQQRHHDNDGSRDTSANSGAGKWVT